jgi:hypothetical protein
MRLFGKKKRKSEPRHNRLFRLMLWSLFKKAKLRERTEKANRWAESHKRQTAIMTVGSLFMLLVIGTVMSFFGGEGQEENIMDGITPVNPMFRELQRIQDGKAYQTAWLDKMALDGQQLKRQLDSLIRIPDKTHDDSLQILIKHKQLEIIVDNLENK